MDDDGSAVWSLQLPPGLGRWAGLYVIFGVATLIFVLRYERSKGRPENGGLPWFAEIIAANVIVASWPLLAVLALLAQVQAWRERR